jgi:hypothetical protein
MKSIRVTSLALLVVGALGALGADLACGGSSGKRGVREAVTGVRGPDGAAATFHEGALPAPMGTLDVTVPSTNTAINGGSTMIAVSSTIEIVKIYVSVQGSDGYGEVAVPAGTTVADVLLTLSQQLPPELVIVFEVVDAAGNISAPATVTTTIVKVKTGDVQVSISWDVDNDVDLHVVDPNGFEIYYGDQVSPEGGELDLDSNASCDIDGVNNENILWPVGKAPAGTYTVRVDNYENCSNMAVNYVVTVQKKGQTPQTFMGSFAADDPGDLGEDGAGVLITTLTYP